MSTPKYIFKKEVIIPMKTFVSEVLDEHQASSFYNRNHKALEGNFIYVFTVIRSDIFWRLNKRLHDFYDFSRKLSRKFHKTPPAFFGEVETPNNDIFQELRVYLEMMSEDKEVSVAFMEFIEDSNHAYEGLQKLKEMYMYKRSGGRYQESCVKCGVMFKTWKIRYFIIHNEGIIYKDQNNTIKQYVTYDYDFRMKHGKKQTGSEKGLILETSHRKLTLEALTLFDYLQFVYYVKQGLKHSEYSTIHRYNSFAPIRQNCNIDFYVDGADYYRNVALSLLEARKEVFIAGWWVSPQFYMIRPVTEENERYRLDRIIEVIAQKGVKVNILVYFESTFLENDSLFTKTEFQKLSSNIKVLRHPITVLPFLWSHHEKMVIIDQQIAYTGGLDLCYARYDTSSHLLYDYNNDMYPGIDYNNVRSQDLVSVKNFEADQYSKTEPRLPWHDIACRVVGEVVWDISLHFIQYWNYASHQIQLNNRDVLVRDAKTPVEMVRKKIDQGYNKLKQFTNKVRDRFMHKQEEPNRFVKYYEEIKGGVPEEQREIQGQAITTTPRIISNKVHVTNSPSFPEPSQSPGMKRAQSAIQVPVQVNPTEKNLPERYLKILNVLNKQPKQQQNKEDHVQLHAKSECQMDQQQVSFFPNKSRKQALIFRHMSSQKGRVQCQVVRSASAWSIGCSEQSTEFSIQVAYVEMIALSKHYIYIENQFFISSCADEKNIKNQIANALVQRIRQAHQKNEPFKVYIILPLLPGFAGEVHGQDSTIMKLNLHWEYQTICRSNTSLIKQLELTVGNWQNYVQFLSIRTHGRLTKQSVPRTEIIYVHSKLMIVDDEVVIVGSANINDRSMNGKRDSEVCVISKDQEVVKAFMRGQVRNVRRAAHQLRIKLFYEHFGIKDPKQLDPCSDQTWNTIRKMAETNTQIYRTVFGCYPDDNITQYHHIESLRNSAAPERYEELTCYIRGQVVQFPLRFLEEQNLNVRISQKEYIMPITLAT